MVKIGTATVRSVGRGVNARGFTLIELMVALLVLGILLGIGVPSFRDAALSSRVTGYANDMVASVQLARSEASDGVAEGRLFFGQSKGQVSSREVVRTRLAALPAY